MNKQASIDEVVRGLLQRVIKQEGDYTDGRALGETFPTMYGVTAAHAKRNGEPAIARKVATGTLTKGEAEEYLYKQYYMPYRGPLSRLVAAGHPEVAYLGLSGLIMGINKPALQPVDDWISLIASAIGYKTSWHATKVLNAAATQAEAGVDVTGAVVRWFRSNRALFADNLRAAARALKKPVERGWVNRADASMVFLVEAFERGAPPSPTRYASATTGDVNQARLAAVSLKTLQPSPFNTSVTPDWLARLRGAL